MDQLTIPTFAELKRSSEDYSVSKRESFPSHGGAVASKRSPRLPSLSLLQWSSGRRYCSEPGALVDSGRSSLTSLGSQESLAEDYPEELDVFSDSYCSSDEESDIEDECYNSGKQQQIVVLILISLIFRKHNITISTKMVRMGRIIIKYKLQ